jgi:hypothetical protein
MNTPAFKSLILAFAALFLGIGLSLANTEGNQPEKEDAISLLESAIKADNPVPLLEKARKQVEPMTRRGRGHQWLAQSLEKIDQAISDANGGNKEGMIAKCRHAIADLHTGMAKAR